jgi:Mg2+ and Co2+ transporter CorA
VNVGGVPGSDNPVSFLVVIVIPLGLAVIEITILRRRKWI